MDNIYKKIEATFGLSLKSLSFFRVLLAISLISDYINRSFDIKAFYTDMGVLPRTMLFQMTNIAQTFSIHIMSDGVWFQMMMILIGILVAILLLAGYKTRTMTIISWILLVSIQNRNPIILQGGDVVFRLLLLWSIFLPLSEYWSIDSLKKRLNGLKPKKYVFNLASLALLAQLIFIYTFSVILKTGVEWRSEFTALYYTLSIDQFTKPFGYFMLKFPEVMKFMTFFTFYAELLAPYLLLIPIKNHIFRIMAIFLMVGLHIGMGLSMHLGQFWWIMVVIWLVFLPDQFWDYIKHFLTRFNKATRLEVYYDDKCGICVRGINVMKAFLFLSRVKFTPITKSKSVFKLANEKNSWVIVRDGKEYFEFEGVIQILKNSLIFWPFARLFEIKAFAKFERSIYRKFSKSRLASCSLPQANKTKDSILWISFKRTLYVIANLIALYFVLLAFMWNYRTIYKDTYIPKSFESHAKYMKIDQWWAMFAPYPLKDDGWFVVVGQYEKKGEVDLFQDNEKVSYEKPENVAETYPNQRWRKYMMNLWGRDYAGYRPSYLNYICRQESKRYEDDRLIKVDMYYMLEKTLPNGQTAAPEKTFLEGVSCPYFD